MEYDASNANTPRIDSGNMPTLKKTQMVDFSLSFSFFILFDVDWSKREQSSAFVCVLVGGRDRCVAIGACCGVADKA